MATMPQSHPWRYRDAAELQAAASSFEYAASARALLRRVCSVSALRATARSRSRKR